jgi:hypothetical protein
MTGRAGEIKRALPRKPAQVLAARLEREQVNQFHNLHFL